jgi:predicted ATP-grasp superfamily ATP-dependent carboligase
MTITTVATAEWSGNSSGLSSGPWVAKRDDGVGCEDMRLFDDHTEMRHWLNSNDRMRTHVVQPYLEGEAASLSLLCLDGKACLLSCNRQLIEVRDGEFFYGGSVLNDMAQH